MILKIFFLILFYFYLRTGIILDSIHTHSPHKELKIPSVHRMVMNIFILGLILTGFYIFSWYFILILRLKVYSKNYLDSLKFLFYNLKDLFYPLKDFIYILRDLFYILLMNSIFFSIML